MKLSIPELAGLGIKTTRVELSMLPTQLLDLHANFIKTSEHRGIEEYHEMNETTDARLCVACQKLLEILKKVVEVKYKVLTHTGVA